MLPPAGIRGLGPVVQVAWLVRDVDVAMGHWLEHGVGPWTCIREIELASVVEGHACKLHLHEALAYLGELQVQLVQSLDPPGTISPYRDWIEQGREGMHHMAFFSRDVEADVRRAADAGLEPFCEMRSSDGHRYLYLRSARQPELRIELLEVYPLLERIFREGIAEAAAWDGSDPVRDVRYADLQG